MNIEELRDYCLSLDGVTEKTPFGKFAKRYESILVFYVFEHMFCFFDIDDFTSVSVRTTSDEKESITARYSQSVNKPLNKTLKNWVQLTINQDIPDGEIIKLINISYEIVTKKYHRKSKC